MFIHFLSICLCGTTFFVLRFQANLEYIGDLLNQIFKILPSYCLASSLYFDVTGSLLSEFREKTKGLGNPIPASEWHLLNITGDTGI